jgi:ketosteroid isomerase-like protein
MITTDPAAVVTRYIYAVRDGDSGAIRDSFAEDAIWEYPGDLPLSGTWRGRDTIVDDFLGSVGTALEPGSTVALEVTSVLTAGNQVVAEWTSRATARGGAAYHNRNVGIFTVRDGKIAAVREYTDTQHAAHVLFGQSRSIVSANADACDLRYRSDARRDRVSARPVPDAADFHDREGFSTA